MYVLFFLNKLNFRHKVAKTQTNMIYINIREVIISHKLAIFY